MAKRAALTPREVDLQGEASAEEYPLSPLQQGMLFHWLLDRHSGTDVEQIVAELHEPIDSGRLQRAWEHALQAFSTLRTSFRWEGLTVPLQRVVEAPVLPFAVEDFRSARDDEREARFSEFLRTDRHRGMELDLAPAMRVTLFRFGDDWWKMVWTFHHILIDGRAFEIILKEVFAAYDGVERAPVADRPYREYVEWLRQEDSEDVRAFWHRKFTGFTAPTPIPADRTAVEGAERFGQRETQLTPAATRDLREFAAREGVSLNTLLMCAWAFLLSRYSGESEVVFGATKTTRRGTLEGADAMVGLFLATVPVRIVADETLTVSEWLQRMRLEWVSLRGSEHYPLVDIREASGMRSSAHLFDSLIVYENYQFGTRLTAQGGTWANRRFQIFEQTGFPLTVLGYGDDELLLRIEYDARRFLAVTVDRMLGHLTTVLDAWSSNSTAPLAETPMLSAEERHAILHDWNGTAAEYPKDVPLAALVEAQVARTPSAPAVTFGSTTLTYAELNTRANQLARELRRHGAGPDVLVGVSIERSAALMVALLAIVKAGAAYVPLDPMFPSDRIAYMLEDSGLQILVTQTSVLSDLPAFSGTALNVDTPTWTAESGENLDVVVAPSNLINVIYTSGSTGRPKGVQVERGAFINLLWSVRQWLELSASDRILAVTTISFDIAGADVWLPWIIGAHHVGVSREAAADGMQLRALIDQHNITFLQATPITWRQLIEANWEGKRNLQAVCTGEAMPPEVAAAIAPIVGRLWNLYGPTETTIWSTGTLVPGAAERISIGRPLANTQCYILDSNRRLVPIGVVGELYIAGDGLARGYFNRPDLTAERFLPNPFAERPGARMYRTGDLARYMSDGTIECLGRTDHQVKIRGFRIELGEIESVLRTHPGVRQAVVIAREDVPGEKRLVAYIVPNGEPADPSALRAWVRRSVPDYMVPLMMAVDAIPLTANGKIDRRALPAPDPAAMSETETIVDARTHVEKQLSEIWEQLFNVPRVSVTDNFFDLGGHSILAVKLMARIAQVFGKTLSLNALFESPTVEQLAKHIEDAGRSLGRHSLVSIQASGTRPPIFWIPGGAALGLFRLANIVTQLGPGQPVYGLGSNRPESLNDVESVEERSRNYLELVRRVQPHGPYCLAGFCAGGRVAFEMAQQLHDAGEVVAFVAMINCSYPRFPRSRIMRFLIRLQRLQYQLRAARSTERGALRYLRDRFLRRAAADAPDEPAELSVPRSTSATGASFTDESLLETTSVVFDRYRPRFFRGRISVFLTDDQAYLGVSAWLDARREWTRHAEASEIRTSRGGHSDLFGPADSNGFAATLKAALDDALRSHGVDVPLTPGQPG